MKALFIAIQNKLIADVPELKFIDFDLGQLEQQPLPSLSYPALLISFGDSPFSDLARLNQQAEVMINVRIAFREFERTHNIAQDQYRAIGLAHLDIVEKVKWALHGLSGDDFTSFSHRSFSTEPRADLRVYALSFETLLCVMPPATPTTPVPWTSIPEAIGDGPELCVQDENGNPI